MARQVLSDQTYTATTTTGNISLQGFTRPWVLLLWQFELNGGSGSNAITIAGKVVANWESDAATEVTFDLDHISLWGGPRVIDDTMISAASGSKYKVAHVVRNNYDYIRLGLTYSGGGTRGFKVNCWVR